VDSPALAYRRTVRSASTIASVRPEVVHIVGGGSMNQPLCQLTAYACGLPVVAGPTQSVKHYERSTASDRDAAEARLDHRVSP
jgi:sugar (pentulose or hexulose) kinase